MKRRTQQGWREAPAAIALAIVMVSGLPAIAQGSADAPAQQGNAAAIPSLQAQGEELLELQKKVHAATGERRAIYRDELLRRWADFATDLDDVVEKLEEEKKAGVATDDQLETVRALTSSVAGGLSEAALQRERALTRLEDQRSEATGDERAKLTREVQRESVIYRSLLESIVDNIERRNRLGVDTSAEARLVDRLLRERAQILEGRLRLTLVKASEIKEQLRGAVEEDESALRKDLNRADDELAHSTEDLSFVLEQKERRGLTTTEGRELLVKATGELGAEALDRDVAVGLVQEWAGNARTWVDENASRLLVKLVVVALVLLAFWFLSRLAGRIVRAWVGSERLDMSVLLQEFFVMLSTRSVQIVGILVALSQLGINLAPLLAGLGIAGFVLGFALQDTLSNFASGLMILAYHPYDVADAVEVAGVLGVVSDMSLVSTTIKTFDNQKLIVPNKQIWGNVIRNLTAEETRRVDLVFGIGYGDDIATAERVLAEEVDKHAMVLKDPAPVIKVSALADSSVNFVVRPWVKTADYWTVYWDLTRSIKLRFDEEGITIPYPQRDVHVFNVGE